MHRPGSGREGEAGFRIGWLGIIVVAIAATGIGSGATLLAMQSTSSPNSKEKAPIQPPAGSHQGFQSKLPFKVPDRSTIPDGPLGEAIRRGEVLVSRTAEELPNHVGNDLHCTSCHLRGGTVPNAAPWVGVAGMFPEYRARAGRVVTLEHRINECFERSMNGKALDPDSPEMTAIVAYITWLSRDVPVGKEVEGRGFLKIQNPPKPNRERGKQIYAQKCAACHGLNGEGRRAVDGSYLFPPLWGDRSFNLGAGMARLHTAAAFVLANMPLGAEGTLSVQDAYDVADFFIHQDRPGWAKAAEDWPHGGKPPDARY